MNATECRLSLRQLLAVAAPKPPAAWFEAVLPPTPKVNRNWRWCAGCHEGHDCRNDADCDELLLHGEAVRKWSRECDLARAAQWPWAYADAVLQAEGKEDANATAQ
jgi:hypothetical protein